MRQESISLRAKENDAILGIRLDFHQAKIYYSEAMLKTDFS